MKRQNPIFGFLTKDISFSFSIIFLLFLSIIILKSVAPSIFLLYFLSVFIGICAFFVFAQLDFDIISLFSKHLYIFSIILLLATLIIGSVTRGTIRWIPIGPISLQPAEIVRPFLLIFFANYLTFGKLDFIKIVKTFALALLPVFLIFIQPSLGVSVLTLVGFLGVLISSKIDKKYVLFGGVALLVVSPLFWFVMAPYQQQRIITFVSPSSDPLGAGYNSLQSTIAAGSGKITGLGLGRGIQTQLSFLPEKQADFIFSAISEELGFVGALLATLASFIILYRLTAYIEQAVSPAARGYLSGFFLTYLIQIFIHIGMNIGLLPVTGLPFPLVSAGGSSLLATLIGLGIASSSYKR
ncbi:MAG: Rod shape-determining protein RodA [Microgenomates group bacterium GW2011_GWC1_39_7b]|uniref:Probable peptidoglycan glycosyltransferase FtsW n=3 Tax=Candidatus Woeseibacteriota TaxID=1752722 RepID=A0A0G0LUQ5_9BACT|nr:MAG: Rod shape-determining protein RodA [Candidatus Woesebacteria bacterium GW2011_GWB1_39_10]KKR26885.1 MAG: Rod shape-determining protein RodA [Microgenomates group bacterium GW2011_GWC1_39_7b]KKR73914.1 MAG: Rod shape-determining protein RodA [Candidatus Woesebacteria bacterium GW2011_GWA2_40_7]KKS90722.1 MAG: Rod shape-determining protein RodA [Candidatus Woesebacteria bacterium GW2011_GWA1_43_12]